MIWFIDSSALVKRYVKEPGSKWVRREIGKHEVFITQVTPVEFTAALCKRLRTGDISIFEFYQTRQRFSHSLNKQAYITVAISQRIVSVAQRLTFTRNLRAYDAIQLSSALIVASGIDKSRFVFITADTNLETASRAEGLQTINPLNQES